MMARYTIRMLGQYLTLTRSQWLDLHDLVSSITDGGQKERARIRSHLDGPPDQGEADQSESWRQLAEANGAEAARRGDEVVRLREALRFTRAERDEALGALRRIDGLAPDQDFYAYARGIARGVLDPYERSDLSDITAPPSDD